MNKVWKLKVIYAKVFALNLMFDRESAMLNRVAENASCQKELMTVARLTSDPLVELTYEQKTSKMRKRK